MRSEGAEAAPFLFYACLFIFAFFNELIFIRFFVAVCLYCLYMNICSYINIQREVCDEYKRRH